MGWSESFRFLCIPCMPPKLMLLSWGLLRMFLYRSFRLRVLLVDECRGELRSAVNINLILIALLVLLIILQR